MRLYDIVIAKKLSGGGGGGGSSDFNKVNVTIINNSGIYSSVFHFYFTESLDDGYFAGFYVDDEYGINTYMDDGVDVVSQTTQEVYILNNKNILVMPTTESPSRTYTLTGDVVETTYEDMPLFVVTGDCTITVNYQ